MSHNAGLSKPSELACQAVCLSSSLLRFSCLSLMPVVLPACFCLPRCSQKEGEDAAAKKEATKGEVRLVLSWAADALPSLVCCRGCA